MRKKFAQTKKRRRVNPPQWEKPKIFRDVKYLNSPAIMKYQDYLKNFKQICKNIESQKCLHKERQRIQLLLNAIAIGHFYDDIEAQQTIEHVKKLIKDSEEDLNGYIPLDVSYDYFAQSPGKRR